MVDGVRTPFGRFKGMLANFSAVELGAAAMSELLRRHPDLQADEVLMAQIVQAGQGQNPARQAADRAGVARTVPAMTLNNVCLASMTSIADAIRRMDREEGRMYIVGGMESMTNAPHVAVMRHGMKTGAVVLADSLDDGLRCSIGNLSMIEVAEQANRELNISREDQDEYAELAHLRAVKAQADGKFAAELVGIRAKNTGDHLAADECLRPETMLEKLAKLRTVMEGGTVTAGNASQLSDGASCGLVSTMEECDKRGIQPLATIVDWATVAGPDLTLHLKPAKAISALLERTGMRLADVDLFEINEAYAGVVIASMRELGLSTDVVNVNGGAIALGHPLGASGFRLVLTLAHELKRNGGGRGIASLCGGGGQGMAIMIEVK